MSLRMTLTSAELEAEDLQAITRDFCNTANQENDLQVELARGTAVSGTRGDMVEIGNLALTFLTSGAAVALINVCKAFFERSSSLEMSFEPEDGNKLTIKAHNVGSRQIAKTIETAREFFGTGG